MPPTTQPFQITMLKNGAPLQLDTGTAGWRAQTTLHAPDMEAAALHARQMLELPPYAAADAARIEARDSRTTHTITRG
ncbi:MAG: hypothetical protein HS117_19300 [Verrucomicrobiaceae bacterium]|nr:hypothetical protein [Verrucomicrobiaceae bacterium]